MLWADLVCLTTVLGCLQSVGFIPFQIAAGWLQIQMPLSVNKRHFVIVKCGVAHLIFQDWKIDFQEYVPEDIQYEIIFLKTKSPSTNKAPQHCVYLCVSVCIYQILYHCYINGMKMGISHFIKLDLKLLDYVLLDVSAAFDLVDHNISLDRLKNWVGLSGTNDLNPI